MGSQGCPHPNPCEYVALHDKSDFSDVIKLSILTVGDYPGLCMWAQRNHKGFLRGRQEGQDQRGDMTTEAEVGLMQGQGMWAAFRS